MRIDAHQHFWQYNSGMEWITPAMSAIRKDFSAQDLLPVLQANNIDGCIAVQVDQTLKETDTLLSIAAEHSFIKGVVGWIDLCAADIEQQLGYYRAAPLLKGFRHILQGEDPGFMLQPSFTHGIGVLGKHGFTYDILVYPKHLPAVLELVKQFPQQRFIIDHLAKPLIKTGELTDWAKDMRAIAAYENVYCKVSGMVSEADWENWQQADFVPYLDVVAGSFGTGRLIFGSDWPVCLTAASYAAVIAIVEKYFSADESAAVFGKNATAFYQLS